MKADLPGRRVRDRSKVVNDSDDLLILAEDQQTLGRFRRHPSLSEFLSEPVWRKQSRSQELATQMEVV
jgi:hypothetical protein